MRAAVVENDDQQAQENVDSQPVHHHSAGDSPVASVNNDVIAIEPRDDTENRSLPEAE